MAEGFEDQRPNVRPLSDADRQILERMALFENDRADAEADVTDDADPENPINPTTKED